MLNEVATRFDTASEAFVNEEFVSENLTGCCARSVFMKIQDKYLWKCS